MPTPHSLIIGESGSGKSRLAQVLAGIVRSRGGGVAVLTPKLNDPWPADFKTRDPAAFLAFVNKSRNVYCFVDEFNQTVGRGKLAAPYQKLATDTRAVDDNGAGGHVMHFIATYPGSLEPPFRETCDTLYLFKSGMKGVNLLQEKFVDHRLEDAPGLLPGEFFFYQGGKPLELRRIDFRTGKIYQLKVFPKIPRKHC